MSTITVWQRDSLTLRLQVLRDDGTPFDLSGAAVAAVARPAAGAALAAAVTVTDAAAGEADLTWATGGLAVGSWRVQAWVTKAGEVQTVYDGGLTVRESLVAP